MAFLSDIIGPGVIDGWTLSEKSALVLSVSAGWGHIDRNVTRTFGEITRDLLDNDSAYVWMRRRLGVIGQGSAFSDVVSVDYTDSTPPAVPTSLQVDSRTAISISFSWSGGSDLDFDFFNIYRSDDNISYSLLETSSEAEYTDSDVDVNTQYYYRVSAVDKTGNESAKSSTLVTSTTADTAMPGDPTSVQLTAAKEAFHLVWRSASFGTVVSYKAIITPITIEGIVSGSSFYKTVASDKKDMTISGLTNGQRYRVVLRSIGPTGVESDGVIKSGTPDNFSGPFDVTDIDAVDAVGDSVISDISLTIEWTPNSDPYGSAIASYEIQLKEFDGAGGSIVSEWIGVASGFSKEFKVFPYKNSDGAIVYKSVDERKDYFITVRAVGTDGLRSI